VELITEIDVMRESSRRWHRQGDTVALVPTMGAFHAGHLALMRRARELAPRTVVSIFVNPLQFGPQEDLSRYPRRLEADLKAAQAMGVDAVFAPSEAAMYPAGEGTARVEMGRIAQVLCGRFRPIHFNGVATVVAKLFHIVEPDWAVFGQKDGQQVAIVRKMVRDLNFPVAIEVVPTVREASGLAMSSRNEYLSPDERLKAAGLYAALREAEERFRAGERGRQALVSAVQDALAARGIEPEYVELVDADELQPAPERLVPGRYLLALAAWVGQARLIDNIVLDVAASE
jgi:pantoate--beta-alanine ligase